MSALPSTSSTEPPAGGAGPAPCPGRLEIGRIAKAHGVRGEVVVEAQTNRAERFAAGSVLFAGERRFAVVAGRPHQGRWIVSFEGVCDRSTAERLRGLTLSAEPLGSLPEGEYWVHELIGRSVITAAGEPAGSVAAVEANPASDLLVLDDGRLVPSVFITDITGDAIVIDPPAGLLDL